MIRLSLLFIFLLNLSMVSAQSVGEVFSKIQISMEGKEVTELVQLGVACDCGVRHAFGEFYEGVFSASEIALLEENDFEYKVVVENMAEYYQSTVYDPIHSRNICDGGPAEYDYPIPDNFSLGDLGGFLTYQQMLDNLDAMAAQYPDLITIKQPIGPILTHEGRPIYWVKISDNPNQDEVEPEVFYNAVHHAREPGGMIQMIYYMWYLLENYDTNDEMQYLVNSTEMYFVPCVNPDGYLWNEINYPNDIYWRKNRRDNGDGTFGVDLNRNYGFEWGFDNNGSSPNTESQTYRGPEAFSEPETQNIRDFCNAHNFQIGMNYHTYGNLLIYPWGYLDTPTAEADIFNNMTEAMTRENNYFAGTGTETVGYTVNGITDDWMYGEVNTKPRIYAMTPEVGPGNFGFWPPQDAIIDIIQNTVQQNLTTAHLVLNMGLIMEHSEISQDATIANIEYTLKKFGLQNGQQTVSLAPISSNIESVGQPDEHLIMMGETVTDVIGYVLDQNIAEGDEIVMELLVDNGQWIRRDTLRAFYGEQPGTTDMWTDNGDDFNNWNNVQGNSWNSTTEDFVSPSSSITDSPNQNYQNNAFNEVELNTTIDLSQAETATLDFWGKWEIESGYDYAMILLSSDGIDWQAGCGNYSVLGFTISGQQPLWEGTQDWVEESVDLVDFIGGPVHIKFRLVSDGGLRQDGFYFDDMAVKVTGDIVDVINLEASDFSISQNRPNPATDYTTIELDNISELQNANLIIHNAVGQKVYETPVASNAQTVKLNTSTWSAGVYFYRVEAGDSVTKTLRMEVVR